MKDETVQRALQLIHGGSSKQKPQPANGITVADVLHVFRGAKVILPTVEDLTKPKECQHCAGNQHARIVKRTWPDGRREWCCSRCGREAKKKEPGRKPGSYKKEGYANAITLTSSSSREQTGKQLNPKITGGEMHIDQMFPSKYLKAADLQGRPTTVTIARVEMEYSDFSDREIHVVYFKEQSKGLPLTRTNAVSIAKRAGPESDDWTGVKITIYPATFKRRGKEIEIIRVEETADGNGKDVSSDSDEPPDEPSGEEVPF